MHLRNDFTVFIMLLFFFPHFRSSLIVILCSKVSRHLQNSLPAKRSIYSGIHRRLISKGKLIIIDYTEKQLFGVFIKGFSTAFRHAPNLVH